ncbi:MAG: hypothetical protein KBT61_06545 [Paraperlucidibaca sp.]|nr:hypothetical protein [Paraperlucidibaca sp.]
MKSSLSLRAWRQRFPTLALPTTASFTGFWAASFVGPFWLVASAPSAINLAGLPGWRGKRFLSNTSAINVLASGDERLLMQVAVMPSLLDGQPTLVCTYGSEAPWPWRFVRDEFREMSPNEWLGMTVLDVPGLRSMGWPFVLKREQ